MRTGSHKFVALIALTLSVCAACNPAPRSYERQIFVFGTIVTIQITGAVDSQAEKAIAALESRYREIDVDWYPWPKEMPLKPGTLPDINNAIGSARRVEVQPDLADLIRRAGDMERLSGGRFNPAIGMLTMAWGFNRASDDSHRVPSRSGIEKMLQWRLSAERLQWEGNTLGARNPFILLDLGGIAKGAILELSVDLLRESGIENAIVDIGGDLTVIGDVGGRAARIGIRSPTDSEGTLGWLEVADGETVVTSGNYERFVEIDGKRYSHILDPRTGWPVMHTSSVTVVHTDPVLADAAATALIVGGIHSFDEICRSMGITQALLLSSTGDLRLTSALEMRVNWTE